MGSDSTMFPGWMFPDLDERGPRGETLADHADQHRQPAKPVQGHGAH
jgi:hypothetical protein